MFAKIAFFLAAFAVFVAAKPADHVVSHTKLKEAAMVIVNDCKAQEGASDNDVKALQAHELPKTKEGVCMMQCLFNTGKVMKNGKVDRAGAIEFFTPAVRGDSVKTEKMTQMIDMCIKEIGEQDDGCQTAKLFIECCNKHGKEFGFNFPNHIKN